MDMSAAFNKPIAGSYDPEDCLFLFKPIQPRDISIAEKEHLIQSGRRHYSEMVTREHPLTPRYVRLFLELTECNRKRLAQDALNLAAAIRRSVASPITLVSLARAGTPIGALLQRALSRQLGVASRHYSISIIRDRGIDERALEYILRHERRPAEGLVFIDGWTAKGVITHELKRSIARWNTRHAETLADALYVIADIGGSADLAASNDDYVIPSGILGAAVSGLVSRSILNEHIGAGDFHGCVVYQHLRFEDRSRWFLDTLSETMARLTPQPLPMLDNTRRRTMTAAYIERVCNTYGITDINHIKPGVLEASRVMLRRLPGLLLLRDPECMDVAHLKLLAEEKNVPVEYDPDMPFNATALIKDLRTAV